MCDAYFLAFDFCETAFFEVAELVVAEGDALDEGDAVAERSESAANLTVATFGHVDLPRSTGDQGEARVGGGDRSRDRVWSKSESGGGVGGKVGEVGESEARFAVGEVDAEVGNHLLVERFERAVERGEVGFGFDELWVCEAKGEVAVVGEQN